MICHYITHISSISRLMYHLLKHLDFKSHLPSTRACGPPYSSTIQPSTYTSILINHSVEHLDFHPHPQLTLQIFFTEATRIKRILIHLVNRKCNIQQKTPPTPNCKFQIPDNEDLSTQMMKTFPAIFYRSPLSQQD